MVPVDGFSEEDIKAFHLRLNSLPLDEKRKAKRKFRKFIRKLEKKNIRLTSSFNGTSPSPFIKNTRRRNVHRCIRRIIIKKLND